MILRRMLLRQGILTYLPLRTAVITNRRTGRQLTAPQIRPWTRSFASEVDRIETSLDNSLKQTHSIESQAQNLTSEPIAHISNETHRTLNPASDEMVERYLKLQKASLFFRSVLESH